MPQNREPCFNHPPISNISSLASILSTTEQELVSLSNQVDKLWKPGKKLIKKNGELRATHDVKEPLKTLHENIKNRLLKRVEYPYYMLGGISDPINPRNCKRHATIHSKKNILITEDVENFFPNVSTDVIRNIWKYCFRFTPEIANLLAILTSYKGCLPQGWKTSGYLANLAFWDKEPQLVLELENFGYSYSRFMDDITVSARRKLDNQKKSMIISKIYGMLFAKNFSPKRKKHEIQPSNRPMVVTGLNVNSCKPTLPKNQRKKIRSQIHKLEHSYTEQKKFSIYECQWNSLSGKVSHLTSLHPTEGRKLRERLRAIKPSKSKLISQKVKHTCNAVIQLEAEARNNLQSDKYKYHWTRVSGLVGHLSDKNREDWVILRKRILEIKPSE